ncbi:MAG: sugar phosphate isomerase/epimerase [Anaerostipes sp.]|nr:sugar phosphate isomerase/epimerase [Anaerostipes sp.]
MKKYKLSLQSSVVGRANLETYIEAAKKEQFDFIEPTKIQLKYYLDAGHTPEDVKKLLGKLKISSVGWLADIDCKESKDLKKLLIEAEELFSLAHSVGSDAVEIINGPVDWHAVDCYQKGRAYEGYQGLLGVLKEEQEKIMVRNLQLLADLAKEYELTLFFEPLCWTPFPSLREGLPLVEKANRDNLKVVVDFYHNYMAGVTLEEIAAIDKKYILGVHICNSKEPDDRVPCEEIFRDAGFYGGVIPIKDWVKAVKKTGFDGWWAYETFSKEEIEKEIYGFVHDVHEELEKLLGGNENVIKN